MHVNTKCFFIILLLSWSEASFEANNLVNLCFRTRPCQILCGIWIWGECFSILLVVASFFLHVFSFWHDSHFSFLCVWLQTNRIFTKSGRERLPKILLVYVGVYLRGFAGGGSQFGKFGKTKEPLILSQESWEKEAFLATVESGNFMIYHQTIYRNGIWVKKTGWPNNGWSEANTKLNYPETILDLVQIGVS